MGMCVNSSSYRNALLAWRVRFGSTEMYYLVWTPEKDDKGVVAPLNDISSQKCSDVAQRGFIFKFLFCQKVYMHTCNSDCFFVFYCIVLFVFLLRILIHPL